MGEGELKMEGISHRDKRHSIEDIVIGTVR